MSISGNYFFCVGEENQTCKIWWALVHRNWILHELQFPLALLLLLSPPPLQHRARVLWTNENCFISNLITVDLCEMQWYSNSRCNLIKNPISILVWIFSNVFSKNETNWNEHLLPDHSPTWLWLYSNSHTLQPQFLTDQSMPQKKRHVHR